MAVSDLSVVMLLRCKVCRKVRGQLVRRSDGETGWYVGRFRDLCRCDRVLPDPEVFGARIRREARSGRGPVPIEPGPEPEAPFQAYA